MNDYVVWRTQEVPHCLVLDELKGVDMDVELTMGIPCSDSFPNTAKFTADPDYPNDVALADTFDNTQNIVLASEKLKEFIESFKPAHVEFLPVTLLNHKKKPAGKYFIVHPVDPVDALKAKESGARWDEDMEWIDSVKKIVLDKDKLDTSRPLFKLKSFYGCVLVRRDLAEAITKQKFTGIKWVECEKFKSI